MRSRFTSFFNIFYQPAGGDCYVSHVVRCSSPPALQLACGCGWFPCGREPAVVAQSVCGRAGKSRPVPPSLVGLCSHCLSTDHVAAQCHFPSRCLHRRSTEHRPRACKRGRSPSRASLRWEGDGARGLRRFLARRPPSPSSSDRTISGR